MGGIPRAQTVAPDDLRRLLLDHLIETMLSGGRELELVPPAWLTVIVMADRFGRTSAPYSSTLYLAIAGSDLLRLRRGELSLDAARRTVRIVRSPKASG